VGELLAHIADLATSLVGNWQYFVDGCLGGIFLEIAVVGGLSRVHHAHITNRVELVVYTIICILGGGLYASRFLGATSDYAAMVEGFTFPITVGSIGGRVPESLRGSADQNTQTRQRRAAARQSLRQRLTDQ
jgi:hypothetical protein